MVTLKILIVIGVLIIPNFLLIVFILFWRRKYVDRKTGWHKCGVCGAVTDPIYYEDGLYRKYHCEEHSPTLNSIKKKK